MAIYDTEEEQLEQLKKWWESNRSALFAGIVGGLALILAVNFWQHYQLENRSQASQMFQEILDSTEKKNNDSVIKIAEKLTNEYGTSAYANFAALQSAKVKVDQGDIEAAKAILQNQIKNTDSAELRHICRLRLIQLLIASKQYQEGLQLISEVDPASTEGFAASYDELQGDLYVAMDRLDEARNAYQSALRTGQSTAFVQFKLDDITAAPFSESQAK